MPPYLIIIFGCSCLLSHVSGAQESEKSSVETPSLRMGDEASVTGETVKNDDREQATGSSNATPPHSPVRDANGQKYFEEDDGRGYDLADMKEPSLLPELEKGVEQVVRFTYAPSHHGRTMVRLVKKNGRYEGRAVNTLVFWPDSATGQVVRPIFNDRELKFEKEQTPAIDEMLSPPDLFAPLTKQEEMYRWIDSGLDGSTWIFERRDRSDHTYLMVWSPPETPRHTSEEIEKMGLDPAKIRDFTVYRSLGIKLMTLAGACPPDDEIY